MRYLTNGYLRTALRQGKSIEQFLGGSGSSEHKTIRWLGIRSNDNSFCLTFYEAIDEGSESFHDLYEFTCEPPDEDPPEYFFATIEEALEYSASTFGASRSRWVNAGVVQDDYADYLRNKRA
jgi:hypothetical protein